MLMRDLRVRLEQHLGESVSEPEFKALLATLANFDDMGIQDFLRRLSKVASDTTAPKPDTKGVADAIVSRLRSAFSDDKAFDRTMDEVAAQKSATKAVLTQIFYDLFERTRGVPKNTTRAELLRLIADERRILVRNERMGEMLGRRIVPAE
jgi:hypothetical protein